MKNQIIEQWMKLAEEDLGVSKHLMETYYPKPLEIICYHCQQAAEKALKAVIIFLNVPGEVPKKHDLSFLLNEIKSKVTIDEALYDYADVLTPYGVVIRYPNEIDIEERHAERAVEYAEHILEWAKQIMESKQI